MKEKIRNLFDEMKVRSRYKSMSDIINMIEPIVNQEVEKRIVERMPSEEDINHEAADRFADKKTGHIKPHLWATFRSGAKWYRSRLTQKTEGGGE